MLNDIRILTGDCRAVLRSLPAGLAQTCVTSPPYFALRDYGVDGQIGLEKTPDQFVSELVGVFREVRRVLADDGTLWLNLGDSYNAHPGQRKVTDKAGSLQETKRGSTGAPSRYVPDLKPKDLIGIPCRVAFALQADGWYLRSDIIWHKPNPMPESVTDRPTSAHEHIFLFAKSARYFYDADAVREPAQSRPLSSWNDRKTTEPVRRGDPGGSGHVTRTATLASREGRNLRNVWTITPKPFKGAHFATFPPDLVGPCIKAGSRVGDTVLDPFNGAGTTGLVAQRLLRDYVGVELNPEYVAVARERIAADLPDWLT